MLTSMAAIVAVLSIGISPTAPETASEAVVPPGRVTVDIVTVNGSGCPAGTAAVAVAADNTAFTVSYSDFLARAGAGSDPTAFRKNCQLGLRVNVPQGFTYGIAQADYRGFAHLQGGATGLERAHYYFQGTSPTAVRDHGFRGPMSDNWQTTDKTEFASIVYAPCGEIRNLNVNTELRVNAGSSAPGTTSFMSMDSTDGNVDTKFHFAWKSC